MRLMDAESSLPTRPVELEDRFMRRCQLKYCDARALLLQARTDLGMTKTEPWTEALKARAEHLYEAKYGKPVPPESTKNSSSTATASGDSDSTVTPGTNQSYSFDISEDTASGEHHHPKSKKGGPAMSSIDVRKEAEDLTEGSTEATLRDDADGVAAAPSPSKKKKRGNALSRVFRLRLGGRQKTV